MPPHYRKTVFNLVHNLCHPETQSSTKQITKSYFWPGMNKDIASWVKTCIPCQKTKIHRPTKSPIGTFSDPDARFSHVHLDIVAPLPISKSKQYLLTMIDRFTRWPEAVSLSDITAESCARAFCDK